MIAPVEVLKPRFAMRGVDESDRDAGVEEQEETVIVVIKVLIVKT